MTTYLFYAIHARRMSGLTRVCSLPYCRSRQSGRVQNGPPQMARQWSAVLGGPVGAPHGGPALHPLPPLPAGYSLGYYPQAFYAQGAGPCTLSSYNSTGGYKHSHSSIPVAFCFSRCCCVVFHQQRHGGCLALAVPTQKLMALFICHTKLCKAS